LVAISSRPEQRLGVPRCTAAHALRLRCLRKHVGGVTVPGVGSRGFLYGVPVLSVRGFRCSHDAFSVEPGRTRVLALTRGPATGALAGGIAALNPGGRVPIMSGEAR